MSKKDEEVLEIVEIDEENKSDKKGFSIKNKYEDEFEIEFIRQDDKTFKDFLYDLFRKVVMLGALCVFGYACYELTLVYIDTDISTENKDEVSGMFLVDNDEVGGGDVYNSEGETIELDNSSDGQSFVWDYDKMLEYNADAKGYIRQGNGEYIDYPILQSSDNDYYLNRLPDHTWSYVGSIFIDYRIKDALESKYCIIYGHYIGKRANNIMFGSLNWYWDRDYYHLEHPTFDIYVEDKHYKYYVFSILKVPSSGDRVYNPEFESDEEWFEYINMQRGFSKYEFPEAPELTMDSKVVVLSTCTTDENIRLVMFLVRGEEILDVPEKEEETDENGEPVEAVE